MAGLRQLEQLILSGNCDINDAQIRHLETLLRLSVLYLSRTQVGDRGAESIAKLRYLQELSLNQCRYITNDSLSHLANLEKLEKLSLTNTGVTNNGLRHLQRISRLRKLNLSGLRITDEGLDHLVGLKNLTYLNLRSSRITDKGLKVLQNLPTLEELLIAKTKVTDEGMKTVASYANLRYLSLMSCRELTDATLFELQHASQLESLNIVGCEAFIPFAFKHFKDYRRLRELHVGETISVVDLSVKHLKNCPDLMILVIRGRTLLTPSVCEDLRTMTGLRLLGLPPDLLPPGKLEQLRHDLPACEIRTDLDDDPWQTRYLGK